jgi:hypothetical protein
LVVVVVIDWCLLLFSLGGVVNLTGNVFDLNDNFLYVGEPCGASWVSSMFAAANARGQRRPPRDHEMLDACGQLVARCVV